MQKPLAFRLYVEAWLFSQPSLHRVWEDWHRRIGCKASTTQKSRCDCIEGTPSRPNVLLKLRVFLNYNFGSSGSSNWYVPKLRSQRFTTASHSNRRCVGSSPSLQNRYSSRSATPISFTWFPNLQRPFRNSKLLSADPIADLASFRNDISEHQFGLPHRPCQFLAHQSNETLLYLPITFSRQFHTMEFMT